MRCCDHPWAVLGSMLLGLPAHHAFGFPAAWVGFVLGWVVGLYLELKFLR